MNSFTNERNENKAPVSTDCGDGVFAMLAPLQPAQRRRSSNISFERHDLSLFADLAEEIDEDDSCTDDSTVDSNDDKVTECLVNEIIVREHREQQRQLPNNEEVDVLLNREIRAHRRSASFHRRTSEVSMDLEDIREAAAEIVDEDDDNDGDHRNVPKQNEEEGASQSMHQSRSSSMFFGNVSVSRTSAGSTIIARAEEEILAKAVQKGKVVVSEGASDSGRLLLHGPMGRRSSYGGGRQSSHTSWSSSGASRRISFQRPIDKSSSGAISTSGSNVQDDIMTALKELRELKCGDEEGENSVGGESGKLEKSPGPENTNTKVAVTKPQDDTATLAVRMKVSSPLPHGAMPRRPSVRTSECHSLW